MFLAFIPGEGFKAALKFFLVPARKDAYIPVPPLCRILSYELKITFIKLTVIVTNHTALKGDKACHEIMLKRYIFLPLT